MKLFDSIGPNPHVVRMVLAEKGIDLPKQRVNIADRENRKSPYLAVNPMGQVPALELDDGRILTRLPRSPSISTNCTPPRRLSAAMPSSERRHG